MHARHGGSLNGYFVVDQVIDWTGPTFEDDPTMRLGRKLQQRRFVLFCFGCRNCGQHQEVVPIVTTKAKAFFRHGHVFIKHRGIADGAVVILRSRGNIEFHVHAHRV